MNSIKNEKNWEIKLGPVQVTVVVGFVLGSLIAMYFLGTWTGKSVGYSLASEAALATAPRQEIVDNHEVLATESKENDVYFKLAKAGTPENKGDKKGEFASPKLGIVETVKQATLLDEIEEEAKTPTATPSAPVPLIRELGATSAAGSSSATVTEKKTLGDIAAQEQKKIPLEVKSERAGDKDREFLAAVANTKSPLAVASPTKSTPAEAPAIKNVAAQRATPSDAAPKSAIAQQPLIRDALPSGWFAQVGAVKSSDEAKSIATTLREGGFPVVIEKAEVRGEQYFRILVGPEESRAPAERLVGQLKREKMVKGDPFLRLVK
jgi:cell division septation protein DedD